MKHFVRTLICVALVMVFTGCQSTFSPEVDNLLVKMRAKIDPQGKLASTTSKVVDGTFRRNSRDKGATVSVKVQSPNLLRFEIIIPGEESIVKAYDGKTGWEYSTKRGYTELQGYQLKALKFQAAFLNPQKKASDIFSKIYFDGEAKVMGQPCFRMVCKPKKEFGETPIIMFVDKKTLLLKKRIEKQGDAKFGYFTVRTTFSNYQSADGILVPFSIISYANGEIMEYEVTGVKWNEKIHISAFDPPEIMQ